MNHASISFIDLRFSTSLAILDLIQPITNRIGEQMGLDEDARYWVWLATQEALNNAVRHGNKMNAAKTIFFRIDMHSDRIVIKIQDEGDGFDLHSIPDPTSHDNLLKPNGRGLFYMHKFMDEVKINIKNGTEVILTKRTG